MADDKKNDSQNEKKEDKKDDKPAGGLDKTPLPKPSQPTYTLKITFHRATALPPADISSLSSDPYVLAQINTSLPKRHKQDPPLRFRSHTIPKTMKPEWNAEWIVAGVPEDGMTLKVRVYDEDRRDADDLLGTTHVHLDCIGNERKGWKDIKEGEYEVKKRRASKRANLFRVFRSCFPSFKDGDEKMVISIECLGKTETEMGKTYTLGPCNYRKHYSPMLGRLMGMKDVKEEDHDGVKREGTVGESKKGGKSKGETQRFDFEANELQLQGPIPNELYHRYVEFKSFVQGMFNGTGLRGRLLNKALHIQHQRIYVYDSKTEYGSFPSPCVEMSQKFLDMVHYDQGGRLFTFVLTSDALFRCCETGPEFGIDLLSKHTMHSDVDIYIAWSGEFLIRRLAEPGTEEAGTHPNKKLEGGPPNEEPGENKDPKYYELIIDNDSGTYRPDKKLIPVFKKFLEKNFPGLNVVVKDGFDDELKKIKEEQKDAKKKEGEGKTVVQGSSSDSGSISSSDEEDLDDQTIEGEGSGAPTGKLGKGVGLLEDPKGAIKQALPGHHE